MAWRVAHYATLVGHRTTAPNAAMAWGATHLVGIVALVRGGVARDHAQFNELLHQQLT